MSWLQRIGTVTFESEFMRERIFYGRSHAEGGQLWRDTSNPTGLDISEWRMFVPEVFLKRATSELLKIAEKYLGRAAVRENIEAIIYRFQERCDHAFHNGELTKDGWGYVVERENGTIGWTL